ncbi:MAG: hypothetical protein IT444_05740 [Phycisphaeraceae bacterium]|nr:hypothetical protein [Phycisphaeraceae bacterium]
MRTFTLIVVAVLGFTSSVHAKFAIPPEAPVDRLVRNISSYVTENPNDPRGYYTLGRVHYLAFSLATETLRSYEPADGKEKSELPQLSRFQANPSAASQPAEGEEKAKALEHLTAAIENFEKAKALNPDDALIQLGIASVWEEGAAFASEVPLPVNSKKAHVETTQEWTARAIEGYLNAYKLSIKKDSNLDELPIAGLSSLVSYEAGQAYLRLVEARGERETERKWVALIREDMKTLEALPQNIVTPIVLSLSERKSLEAMIDSRTLVKFDLDGTSRSQWWSWIKPDTCLLIWDPMQRGEVTSGKQLFGSVTFWMFWPNGYAALDALDDNRDGRLAGDELTGLALWADCNSNGISENDEVMLVEESGIESISTRATSQSGMSPCNLDGLKMKDGRLLPTYDWTTQATGIRR